MIKLKFKNKDKELEFFKIIPYLNEIGDAEIRYAEMISDMDVAEKEKDEKDDE